MNKDRFDDSRVFSLEIATIPDLQKKFNDFILNLQSQRDAIANERDPEVRDLKLRINTAIDLGKVLGLLNDPDESS